MRKLEVWIALCLITLTGSCIACSERDRNRCQPVCEPYIYSGVAADGKCICDTTKVKKEVR